MDMINTLRIVVEQSGELQALLFLFFIDFEKEFDSLDHEAMWRVLRSFGVQAKLINIIKETYNDYVCQVIHKGKLSNPLQVNTGVRQGCLLSPIIFLRVLDLVLKKVTMEKNGNLN